MKLMMTKTPEEVTKLAAKVCKEFINNKPNGVLALATGSTPVYLYQELIGAYRAGELSFKDVTVFNLDEYLGLQGNHPQSYQYFMRHHLFEHIDIELTNTHIPCENNDKDGKLYEAKIAAAGGIDLQLLGLGRNGHIGFNEPGSSFQSVTRRITLEPSTLKDNRRFFNSDELQPTQAMTMGIGTILRARRIVLLATGKTKAAAVKAMIQGPISMECPASALQLHGDTQIIVDQEAASELTGSQYVEPKNSS